MGLKPEGEGDPPFQPRSHGLGILLQQGDADGSALRTYGTLPPTEEESVHAAAAHVFDLSQMEQAILPPDDKFYPGLLSVLHTRLDDLTATAAPSGEAAASSSASEASGEPSSSASTSVTVPASSGRLGPAVVEVDQGSWTGLLSLGSDGLTVESIASFSSFRATACVYMGKWMFETTILTSGIQQIGWATTDTPFTAEEGVGDAPDSYAYDGKRIKKWNGKCTQYGQAWAAGDVIGSCLDLDRGELTFYRNGTSMGVAFTGIKTMQAHAAYFPAVSLSFAERCVLNFGAQLFRHPVAGYQPVQLPPAAPAVACASYLTSCLERLATNCRTVAASEGGQAAAVAAAAAAATSDLPRTAEGDGGGGAAAAASRGAPAGKGAVQSQQRFRISLNDQLLLGSLVVDQMLPYLLDPYLVSAILLPTLLGLATSNQPSSAAALSSLLQILELSLDPEILSPLIASLMDELARRCAAAALVPEQFPYSASYPYLCLASAIAARAGLRAVWLRHSGLWQQLEGLLTRKSPNQEDLKGLIPQVWWRGCPEEGTKERMRGALQALSTAIARVEDKQYELLVHLIQGPARGNSGARPAAAAASPPTPSPSGPQQQQQHQEEPVLDFLSYLVHKNRGATRDIPPPGLSDPTALISAYYVLVRMLRTSLPLLSSFPAGALFVKTAIKADLEPINDLARLGGVITHLCREAPVAAADQLPLPVAAPPALPSPSDVDLLLLSKVAGNTGLVAELVNVAMSLYAFRVSSSVKLAHNLSTTLSASLAGLEEVERHLMRNSAGVTGTATATAPAAQPLAAGGPAVAAVAAAGVGPSSAAAAAVAAAAAAPPGSYLAYLREARDFFREDVASNIRFGSLLKVVFFSAWKQDASLVLAVFISRVLLAAAERGPLLGYVPTCYTDCVLDTMASLRHAQESSSACVLPPSAASPPVRQLLGVGLDDVVAMLSTLLHDHDGRIANPDVKESLVACVSAMLDQRPMLEVFEANATARERLVAAAVACFDSRLWHPVAQVLLKLVRGQGFGEAGAAGASLAAAPEVATSGAGSASSNSSSCGRPASAGSDVFRGLLVECLRPETGPLPAFLTRLFNMLGWATTEFAVTVSELHDSRGRRHMSETQQQYRKAGIMFELVTGLLRIMEFIATKMPDVFLTGSNLNVDRLLEVIWFVLSHFTEGADARRLNELLVPASSAMSSTVRMERTMLADKVSKPLLLAPVIGTLVGLWHAGASTGEPSCAAAAAAAAAGDGAFYSGRSSGSFDSARSASAPGSGNSSSDGAAPAGSSGRSASGSAPFSDLSPQRRALLDALARHWDARTEKQLAFLRALDWRTGLPAAAGLDEGIQDFEALCLMLDAYRVRGAAAGGGAPGAEVPDEMLDPITMTLMTDPVVLPDSQVTVDRATIERHLLTSPTDPFSRSPITLAALKPNTELKEKIQAWVRTSRAAAKQ